MSRRVEMGLEGGGVLVITLEDADIATLNGAYAGDRGLHLMTGDEGDHVVNLDKVTYVRVPPGEVRSGLGFGGGL